jgi:hypothetical protein
MKKPFWMGLVFYLSVLPLTAAETYYVDSLLGQDAWTGKFPSPSPLNCSSDCTDGPWRSLTKIYTAPFNPGDSILLRSGRTWTDGLTLRSNGTLNLPILVGAYGAGAPPLISPPNPIVSWTGGPPVWEAGVPQKPSENVWVEGIRQEEARTPNADAAGIPVYFTIESTGPLPTQFVVKDEGSLPLPPANEVVGSTVQLHATNWTLEKVWVTDYDSTTRRVTLSTNPVSAALVPQGRFFLTGKRSYIDQPGEWDFGPGCLAGVIMLVGIVTIVVPILGHWNIINTWPSVIIAGVFLAVGLSNWFANRK